MNDTCACGHVRDEHHQQGTDPKYPGSRRCTIETCPCIHFEEDGSEKEAEDE